MALHKLKNPPFPQNKTFSFAEDLPKHPSKATLFRIPKAFHLHTPFFAVLKRHPILQTKSFSFAQAFPYRYPKHPFSTTNAANSLLAITYCPQKHTAILLQFALNPHAVTPERRTDSKPFRRRFARKTGFGSCRRKLPLKSSPAEL